MRVDLCTCVYRGMCVCLCVLIEQVCAHLHVKVDERVRYCREAPHLIAPCARVRVRTCLWTVGMGRGLLLTLEDVRA